MPKIINNPLTALKLSSKTVKSDYTLHILSDANMERADLDLPRLGRKRISSKFGEKSFMDDETTTHLIIGAGKFDLAKHANEKQWEMAIGALIVDALKSEKITQVNVANSSKKAFNTNVAQGAYVRSFTNDTKMDTITIANVEEANVLALAEGINLARVLINKPFGIHTQNGEDKGMTVQNFVELLKKDFNVKSCYSTHKALHSIKAGGILAVGKGSKESPALLDVGYCHPDCKKEKPRVFIAKGLMYDTGGAAIKPADSMKNMKYDMGAAAIATGMLHALKESNAKTNVRVIYCLADNAVSDRMYVNGDHVVMMDGKVCQIIDTDAEGRVVLYDGLVYAQSNYKDAKFYTTMGTLTATGRAVLGGRAGMYLCANEALSTEIVEASQLSADETFRLPVDQRTANVVYSKEPGVDIRNYNAGTICNASELAYNFLKASLMENNENRYMHFDIGGGTIYKKADITGESLPYESATGWGVNLWYNLATL